MKSKTFYIGRDKIDTDWDGSALYALGDKKMKLHKKDGWYPYFTVYWASRFEGLFGIKFKPGELYEAQLVVKKVR